MTATLTPLVLVGLLLLAWPLATGSLPTSTGSGRRADAHRLRYVERRPGEATTADVARLLRAHELPEEEVRFVLTKAEQLGVGAFTLWMWVKRFGVHALAVVLGADLPHVQLLRHLGEGSLPDLAELEVFAALNGMPRARGSVSVEPYDEAPVGPAPPAVSVASVEDEHESAAAPPPAPGSGLRIVDPGSWPFAA